ncbi:hypothetical protein Lspi_0357 [Legionella spiritensis]|uniref:Uncharacterized protein n=1 Tax=Legionella spiritensis TaxID=452 RepID=A0A0W0Z944_LEGSP|nr:hypothetical protein Lspi_0357 [Legionella spiritensis]SNV43783.1 Uncharacterised protein [Legionella spiritensis]
MRDNVPNWHIKPAIRPQASLRATAFSQKNGANYPHFRSAKIFVHRTWKAGIFCAAANCLANTKSSAVLISCNGGTQACSTRIL